MLSEIYIEALLANEELADQVWDAHTLNVEAAGIAWMYIVLVRNRRLLVT